MKSISELHEQWILYRRPIRPLRTYDKEKKKMYYGLAIAIGKKE